MTGQPVGFNHVVRTSAGDKVRVSVTAGTEAIVLGSQYVLSPADADQLVRTIRAAQRLIRNEHARRARLTEDA